MTAAGLLSLLPVNAFVAFAVFCRVGAFFMTAPAFGDYSLSPRLRLAAALAAAAALAPVASTAFPAAAGAAGPDAMSGVIAGELLIGGLLGLAARVMMSALNVAGQIIALQAGLSLAQIFDPTQQLQGAIVGGFLAILGTTLIFASDAHHLLLAALADSYALAPPGLAPASGDMAELIVGTLSSAFALGLRLAAPFVLFGLVFYAGAGLLNRLMPQAQVFFMLMPANIALGILLLMLTTGLMMNAFMSEFERFLAPFLR